MHELTWQVGGAAGLADPYGRVSNNVVQEARSSCSRRKARCNHANHGLDLSIVDIPFQYSIALLAP